MKVKMVNTDAQNYLDFNCNIFELKNVTNDQTFELKNIRITKLLS